MEDKIALHHSSLDKEDRKRVEEGVKDGLIKWVVCTSSLDLGVDFQPVDQIVQIGSAKNLARLIQRAGSCLLYTSPSPRDTLLSRMPSSA